MPSPLHWDRKEVPVKDRKQERGSGCDAVGGVGGVGGGSCSTSRWREPYHGQRDFPRASPRRPFTGHDGGYQQLYSEESSGHGCTPSWSGDRYWPEEDIFRLPSGRCGGRTTSSGGRESRGSSRRSPCVDSGGDYARQHHVPPVTAQRSVAVPITQASSSSLSPIPLRNLPDKSDGAVIDDVGTGQKYDRDHCLGSTTWKALKWSRSSCVPSAKTVRSDAEEANAESLVPQVRDSPARSPVTSHLPLDDRALSKKPRLGWGQGLAKYEKQKVEGSVDVSGHNGSVQSSNSAKFVVTDSSPKISVLAGSMSPATPTSVTCSSSPAGTDEKLSIKGLNTENDRPLCGDTLVLGPSCSLEDISIKLDQPDGNSLSALALLLSDLMQPEDACSGDSSFTKNSTMSKLLLLKKDISKELEKTECEIDLFENKLKSINCDALRNNFQEFTSVDTSKSLVDLSSGKCELSSSVALEGQQSLHTRSTEEPENAVKDTIHNSSGAILCDEIQSSSLENPNSSNLQCDSYPVSIIDVKAQLPDDICTNEQAHCLDYRTEIENDRLVTSILTSNRDSAKSASGEFDQAMPPGLPNFNISELDFLQCKKNYMRVRGRLAMNKCMLKFKERVLVLKFRALHYLWREDLNLLTMRKNRSKSSKRYEIASRSSQTGSQKHRSSFRSRFVLPAGNVTLVPTTEILNFTGKLLLDSQMRLYRDNLKMPAQIIDENDRRYSRFNSNNGLIENPPALEKERVMVNPWMHDEKEIFLEMLAKYGKDFQKISSCLSHKTTADCIEFYYKNHKSESFNEVKQQLKRRKQLQSRHSNTYLITSGSRFNRETNAASLELLGAASLIAAESNCNKSSLKQGGKMGYNDRVSRRSIGSLEKAYGEISESEREVAAADVLAGICGALSSDAMSSCVTSSIDPPEKLQFATIDCLTQEAAHTIDEEDTCSDDSSDELESADWTDEEKSLFIRALNMHGKDFVKVAHFVRTRSQDQCKIFFSKARKCLGLDVIQPGSVNGVTPLSDINGGRSDTDDACAAEIDSAICSTQSCSKMDVDFTHSLPETCSKGHTHAGSTAEIGGSILDEFEGIFDDKASVLNDDKLVNERGNLVSGKDQGEICSSGLGNNEPLQVHGSAESHVDSEINNEIAEEMPSQGKSAIDLHDESKFKSPSTAEAARKASNGSSVAYEPNKAVDSGLLEESGDVGDSLIFVPKSHSIGNFSDDGEQKSPNLLSSNIRHQVPLELLCSLQKPPQTQMVQPVSAVSSRLDCLLPESSSIPSNQAHKESSIATLNMLGGAKSWKESVSRDLSPNQLKSPFLKQIDSPPYATRCCPVQSSTQNHDELKKINEKMIVESSSSQCDRSVESKDQSQRGNSGDLKLFGQILTHQSSQKSSHEGSMMPNAAANSIGCWKDAAIFMPMPTGRNGLVHHQAELPQRTYGFWDGNRVQTGLSSLPESAIILANYQGSLAGRIPFSISKESAASCNGDHQQAQIHPPSKDKFLDSYSELQKRNGFDLLSGFQQQGSMMHLGVNIVGGGGGIVVGGANGVSDPVAALQLHYSGRRKILAAGDLETLMGDTVGR